jgi:MtN3 and saliva related transmembrane protein
VCKRAPYLIERAAKYRRYLSPIGFTTERARGCGRRRGCRAALYRAPLLVLGRRGLKLVDWIGWLSSGLLVLTLSQQVRKQWRSGESRGVSPWLFAGQLAASIGFSIYSYLLENWVFLATNLLLVINALLGEWVTLRNRRRAARKEPAPG